MMEYNTRREKLVMPEHGRHVQKMIEQALLVEDPQKRRMQLQAIVNVMRQLDNGSKDVQDVNQKLWDHVQVISGYRLSEGDSPYPVPTEEVVNSRPEPIPGNARPIKATHYGRNIESMIDVIAERPDDEVKTAMIRALAIYMRQQYLIWNKDSVADETIFMDIVRMSGGRIRIPEDMTLTKIASDANFSRPGLNPVGKFNRNQKKNKGMQSKRRG